MSICVLSISTMHVRYNDKKRNNGIWLFNHFGKGNERRWSSSKDAGVGHGGDIHWAPNMALVLWPSAECLCDVYERSHEGLHLPRPTVSCNRYEPVFLSALVVQWGHLGWYLSLLSSIKVPHWWRVWFGYLFCTYCFFGFRSFAAILPKLSCGVCPIRAFSPISDSLDFWFVFFFCCSSSRTTLSSWSWVHSYLHYAPWTWVCSRGRT